jgi:hypothetical protein
VFANDLKKDGNVLHKISRTYLAIKTENGRNSKIQKLRQEKYFTRGGTNLIKLS